jgi:hypothetical protein
LGKEETVGSGVAGVGADGNAVDGVGVVENVVAVGTDFVCEAVRNGSRTGCVGEVTGAIVAGTIVDGTIVDGVTVDGITLDGVIVG